MACLSFLSLLLIILAICEICGQECARSSLVTPDQGGFLFSHDDTAAQLICRAGFHPENNEYTTLRCNGVAWEGNTPANCVPNKCRKCVLEWTNYWPENGRFQFSPDSGSELLEHLTEATVVCDAGFYLARQNMDDMKYYTTLEDETLKCNYGHWMGERTAKCIPNPGDSAKQDMYQYYHTRDKDMFYSASPAHHAANVRRDGYRFSLLRYSSDECQEKVPLYRFYLPIPQGDHVYTTSNKLPYNYEGIAGACVSVKGQCGMTHELHRFYHSGITAHLLVRDVSHVANWRHEGIVCYIY